MRGSSEQVRWVRCILLFLLAGVFAASTWADVSITDRGVMLRRQHSRAEKDANKSASSPGGLRAHALSTGQTWLIDASGFKYFINENITFSTASSASGAMSEASYTHAVPASTSAGGVTSSTLNDAFDGYNTLCVSLNGTIANCETGNANFVIYQKLGYTGTGIDTTECAGRQIIFPTQSGGSLPAGVQIVRKVYVPTDDSFARWLNIFSNAGSSSVSFGAVIANNLGSDANTKIVSSSNGNNVAELTDTWVTTFQNFTGKTSSDPRLGHILQGVNVPTPLAGIHFADGDDNPFWGYTITLQPGETKIIMNFVTGMPTKAAANAQAARLAMLPPTTIECMTGAELSQLVNFTPQHTIPSLTPYGIAALGILLLVAAVWVLRVRLS